MRGRWRRDFFRRKQRPNSQPLPSPRLNFSRGPWRDDAAEARRTDFADDSARSLTASSSSIFLITCRQCSQLLHRYAYALVEVIRWRWKVCVVGRDGIKKRKGARNKEKVRRNSCISPPRQERLALHKWRGETENQREGPHTFQSRLFSTGVRRSPPHWLDHPIQHGRQLGVAYHRSPRRHTRFGLAF